MLRFFILSLIFLTGGSVFSFYSLLYEQNDISEPTVILVEKGDNLSVIARRLKQDGLLDSVAVFKAAARFSGKSTSLKAGEYRIPPYASAKEILDILVAGQTTVRRVTIPEGKTSRQIFEILAQTAGLVGDLPEPPPNGTLLPETYTFSYGMPRKIIVERMTSGMRKTIDELWPGRDKDLPYATKEEALVLASIIEKETSVGSERPRIAGVFINRLRKGMRLQTDPTVIYAITGGTMELNRKLTHNDLLTPHPFNTYRNKGLPPAPICNPGRESLQAVLRPQKTNEIYFVADGTGGHAFATSFDEHRKNILNWKKTRRRKRLAARMKNKNIVKPVQTKNMNQSASLSEGRNDGSEQLDQPEQLDQQDISSDILDDVLDDMPAERAAETVSHKSRAVSAGKNAVKNVAAKKSVKKVAAKNKKTGSSPKKRKKK